MNHAIGSAHSADAKPFLLLSTRGENAAAHEEQLSFARATGLAPVHLHQMRLERGLPGDLDLDRYSAVIVGGGPFNYTDENKSRTQRNIEAWFKDQLANILQRDFPFFGACYGVGLLSAAAHGRVSRTYGEQAAVIPVALTDEGVADPVLADVDPNFHAIVGHKEAIEELPDGAVLLARGEACPTQMFRLGKNAYATQFHPELDAVSFEKRLRIYAGQGYYQPGAEAQAIADSKKYDVGASSQMLRNFVSAHATPRAS
ncbi:glutamine amidotransferase [Corynebacterium sp. TAE3-ERU12]|uniref:glutamine amidotransferase n=1 Tax=Corynebacterium sp. TAE3-ERU12 TaxID=2849491 RepID=UPI001C4735CE|nr:glutamine amidotransferase [Corynebacterium sp. TAE3-ERU12]MBV7295436.1 glutamine amidotransferase [Corynebacterium sp. TAE3-ERU12]